MNTRIRNKMSQANCIWKFAENEEMLWHPKKDHRKSNEANSKEYKFSSGGSEVASFTVTLYP